MKNHKIIYFTLLFLISITNLEAEKLDYNLRRFDTDFYERSYKGTVKYNLEKRNKRENDIKIIKTKSSKYDGHYKIGKPYTVLGKTYYPKEQPNYKEVGMASWYGSDFHNKKTANGETYNMNDYTAAHRTLPMPCMVRITNLENGKSANVRVNDRGPFAKSRTRIIDVSEIVAKKLDFYEEGTAMVRVEYLKEESEELLKEYGLK